MLPCVEVKWDYGHGAQQYPLAVGQLLEPCRGVRKRPGLPHRAGVKRIVPSGDIRGYSGEELVKKICRVLVDSVIRPSGNTAILQAKGLLIHDRPLLRYGHHLHSKMLA